MTQQTTSDAQTSVLRFAYTGEPVRVDPDRIHADMWVPDITELHPREAPGCAAAALFFEAQLHGALVAPDGITIECYADEDADASGFTLVAYDHGQPRRGVTCGWRDVDNIARRTEYDPRATNNAHIVREALEFFAAELNVALGVGIPADEPIVLAPAQPVPAAGLQPPACACATPARRLRRTRRFIRRTFRVLLVLSIVGSLSHRHASASHSIPSPKGGHHHAHTR